MKFLSVMHRRVCGTFCPRYTAVVLLIFSCGGVFSPIFSAQGATSDTVSTYKLCFPDDKVPLNNAVLANLLPILSQVDGSQCLTYVTCFESSSTNGSLVLNYSNARIPYPLVYKGFSLRDLMFPVTATLDITVATRGSQKRQSAQFEIKQGSGSFLVPGVNMSGRERVSVSITSIELGQEILERLTVRQSYIEDYYNIASKLKTLETKLYSFDSTSLPTSLVDDAKVLCDEFQSLQLESKIFLNENDPEQLLSRLDSLRHYSVASPARMEQQAVDLSLEYLRLGDLSYQAGDLVKANELYHKALSFSPRLAIAHIKLARVALDQYDAGLAVSSLLLAGRAGGTVEFEADVRNQGEVIATEIISSLAEDARLARQQGLALEAKTAIDSCYSLCNALSFAVCGGYLDIERDEVYTSYFFAMVDSCGRELSVRNYDAFITKVDCAVVFLNDNRAHILRKNDFYAFLNASYARLIADGRSLLEESPVQALDALMSSKVLCRQYNEVTCDSGVEELLSKVFVGIYNSMVDEATWMYNDEKFESADSLQLRAQDYCLQQSLQLSEKHNVLQRNLAEHAYRKTMLELRKDVYAGCEAVRQFESAYASRRRFGFIADSDESVLDRKASVACCSQQLTEAEKHLLGRRFDNVTQILSSAETYIVNKGLSDYLALQARIDEIRGEMTSVMCEDRKFQIDVLLNAVDQHQARKEYQYAHEQLRKVRPLLVEGGECGYSTEEIDGRIAYVGVAAAYQRSLDQAIESIQHQRYSQAMDSLIYLQESYPDSLLASYGIEGIVFDSFVRSYDFVPFSLKAAEILADRGYDEDALKLIYLLYEKDVQPHLTNVAQEKLGRSYAIRDFEENKDKDPRELVYRYNRHDEDWFRRFVSSYRSQWKKSLSYLP